MRYVLTKLNSSGYFSKCRDCGALVLSDLEDQAAHDGWHDRIDTIANKASSYKPPPRYGRGGW